MNSWRAASDYLRVRRAERHTVDFIAREQQQLLKACARKIAAQEDEIAELHRLALGWQQQTLAVATGWRISVEKPEEDVRDPLDEMIRELRDQIGQIEEFVT